MAPALGRSLSEDSGVPSWHVGRLSDGSSDALLSRLSDDGAELGAGPDSSVVGPISPGSLHWEQARWGLSKKLLLVAMMALLVTLGGAETVAYSVNGKLTMVPYRCFLHQLVVLVCVAFFSLLDWLPRRVAAGKLRAGIEAYNTPLFRPRRASEDFGYQSLSEEEEDYYDGLSLFQPSPAVPGSRLREMMSETQGKYTFCLFFVMALCDTVSLYVSLLASHNIGGALRLVLQQLSIPLSMGLSYLLLGRNFSSRHMLGSAAVVLGVFLCLVDVLEEIPGQLSSPNWAILFMLSCIPITISGCLKEWVLIQGHSDANSLNAWVALIQLLIGTCLVPIGIMIQNMDMQNVHVDLADIPLNFWAGFKCGCLGIVSYDESGSPLFGQQDCAGSVISTWLYIFSVCAFNLLMVWVIREGTAVLFFVANGVIIPLVVILSTTPVFAKIGLAKETFTMWQVLGLTATIFGCFVFGTAVIKRSESNVQEVLERSATSSRFSRRQL